MITTADMSAIPAAPAVRIKAAPLAERILLIVLYITVLASSVAFIEPSPHDGLMGLLAVACLVAGASFHRMLAVPLLLLLVWNVGGLISLFNVVSDSQAVQYAATSVYLGIAAILFAALLTRNTMPRIAVIRAAYILTAVLASLAGIAGYFHLFPGAYDLFTMEGRALGGFKDPNVFAPFLIWPALVVLERIVAQRIRFLDLVAAAILLFALLLAFSRGAWFHFALSGAIMLALIFLTAPTRGARLRILGMSAAGVLGLAGLVVVLLSFQSIGAMFFERAQLVQSYDVDSGGRFAMQQLAVNSVLQFPNGMGPFGFANLHGLQQHNVYLQAFLVYGWAGGMGYVLLLLTTLIVGLRNAFVRSPWQVYAIITFAVFVGEVAEGAIIDTDHWRHFFLLLGMIWGLAAASANRPRTGIA